MLTPVDVGSRQLHVAADHSAAGHLGAADLDAATGSGDRARPRHMAARKVDGSSQHDPPPASRVGRPAAAGLIVVLPVIVIRPVATRVTPVSTATMTRSCTSPAT